MILQKEEILICKDGTPLYKSDSKLLDKLRGTSYGWHGFPWFSWTNFWIVIGQTYMALAILKLISIVIFHHLL